MSYTDNVADFMLAPTKDVDVNFSDLELIAGDIIEKVRSRSNSPTSTAAMRFFSGQINFFATCSFSGSVAQQDFVVL